MADKRLDQTTNASAVAAADNIPFVTAAGVTSYVTGDELAASGPFSSRYVPLTSDVQFLGAAQLGPITATPTLGSFGMVSYSYSAWLLDDADTEWVGGQVWIPAHWSTFHVDLYWSRSTTGSGNVKFDMFRRSIVDGQTLDDSSAVLTVTVAAANQYVANVDRLGTGVSNTAGAPLTFMLGRRGENAADTLVGDVALLGVAFVRAS